jgi:hypothetical protein
MKRHTGSLERRLNASSIWKSFEGSIMDIELPFDFKEFLKLLNEKNVRYLLIGGYEDCYASRIVDDFDGVKVDIIASPQNKQEGSRSAERFSRSGKSALIFPKPFIEHRPDQASVRVRVDSYCAI